MRSQQRLTRSIQNVPGFQTNVDACLSYVHSSSANDRRTQKSLVVLLLVVFFILIVALILLTNVGTLVQIKRPSVIFCLPAYVILKMKEAIRINLDSNLDSVSGGKKV